MQPDTRKALIRLASMILPVILALALGLWILFAGSAQTPEGSRAAGPGSAQAGKGESRDTGNRPSIVTTSADEPDEFISALTGG